MSFGKLFLTEKFLSRIILLLILINLGYLFYFLVFKEYFQQDEWLSFSNILSQGTSYLGLNKNILEILVGERTGGRLIFYSLFSMFGLNPLPYGLLSFLLHGGSTLMVFLITRRLTGLNPVALLASLFFLTNEVANESYTWFSAMNSSAPALLFFLLSLYFYMEFLVSKKLKTGFLTFIFLIFSLFFKESAVFAFVFYPILFILYKGSRVLKNLKIVLPFLLIGVVILAYFFRSVIFIEGNRANYIALGSDFTKNLLTNSVRYPTEGLVQTLIPNQLLFSISPITGSLMEPGLTKDSLDFLVASQNRYAEVTIIFILIIFSILFFFILKKSGKNLSKDAKKTLTMSIIMAFTSFLPYIVLNRSFSYFDSRHYYFASSGLAIFLASFIFLAYKGMLIKKVTVVLIALLFLLAHEFILFSDIKLLMDRSSERQKFLEEIERLVPQLPKKSVFYITGNSPGYYGLTEIKVPFQSGLGNILLVNYAAKGKIEKSFLSGTDEYDNSLDFLYDIFGEGYRKKNDRGFGYYFDKDKLNSDINKGLFSKADVIPLFYDANSKILKKLPLSL